MTITPENLVHPRLFEALKQYEGCLYSIHCIHYPLDFLSIPEKLEPWGLNYICSTLQIDFIKIYPDGADKEPVTFHTKDY